jgi:hypothetical protein
LVYDDRISSLAVVLFLDQERILRVAFGIGKNCGIPCFFDESVNICLPGLDSFF